MDTDGWQWLALGLLALSQMYLVHRQRREANARRFRDADLATMLGKVAAEADVWFDPMDRGTLTRILEWGDVKRPLASPRSRRHDLRAEDDPPGG